MMSSLSDFAVSSESGKPVSPFDYQDMTMPNRFASALDSKRAKEMLDQEEASRVPAGPTSQEIEQMIRNARAEGTAQGAAEAEKRVRAECESRIAAESAAAKAAVHQAIERFAAERKSYYSRVETDVVQLALSIAAKILHREAQVDPLLLSSLVRVAVEKMQDASRAAVRVHPQKAEQWRKALASPIHGLVVTVTENADLNPQDCILETELGSANFGLDAQLKEIEQGFFDLLAQRPS